MNIIISIFILGFLVAIHEFGHFIVAKISGMYVTTFSIGMGPKIASFQKGETEYVISVIPAGGFVSVKGISGDPDEDNDPDDPRLFQNRPIIHRMLFTLAGPFMNFLTALAALLIFYLALGVNVADNDSPPIIAEVTADSAAASAGLEAGDELLSINGQTIQTWNDVDQLMENDQSGDMDIVFARDGETKDTVLTPAYNESLNRYALGVTKQLESTHQTLSFSQALRQSAFMTAGMSTVIFDAVMDLVTGRTAVTDEEGGLSGPVGIVNAIGDSVSQGVWSVVSLVAILSVNFGLLNLLPVPALDGSRFLFLVIEAVRGIPVSQNKEMLVNLIGVLALGLLMVYVTYNDILNLVN